MANDTIGLMPVAVISWPEQARAANSWINVGSAGFSAGLANYTSIALDSYGTPYVAYRDGGNSGKATVMKFAGYTVTYNAKDATGGSVPTDSGAYEQGTTISVQGNTGNLMNTGYTFAGWNTKEDGTGTDYAAGATFSMGTANVTLYAQWTANPTYTVTYDGNTNTGGSVPTDSGTYEQGTTVTVLGNTGSLVKTGYTFAGWNTQAAGNGADYTANATFYMGTASVTLYAKWTAKLMKGDVNDDGQLTPADAQIVYKYAQGKITLTDDQKQTLDMNEDGKVDAADAKIIMNIYLGLGG